MYGPQTFQQVTDFQQRLTNLLAQFQQKGAIAPNVPLNQVSSNSFALYVSTLGLWLSGFLSFEEAQGQALHRAFALQIQDMQSREPGV